MGCMHGKPVEESEIEKCAHVRRKTQHLIQNLVHEEFRLKVEEVRAASAQGQQHITGKFATAPHPAPAGSG